LPFSQVEFSEKKRAKIRLAAGLHPNCWGSLQRSPDQQLYQEEGNGFQKDARQKWRRENNKKLSYRLETGRQQCISL